MREERALSALLARRPDALIMVGSPATTEGAGLLRRARIPIVETWDLPAAPIDAVAGFDNYAAGVAVAGHLATSGRRMLAFIGGNDPRAGRRWAGFSDTAVLAGLRPPLRLVLDRDATAGATALASLPGIDAVFAANDAHAIGLIAGLRDADSGTVSLCGGAAGGRRGRARRSGDGPADHAPPQHHPRPRRQDRARCGGADARLHGAAPDRPGVRVSRPGKQLITLSVAARNHRNSCSQTGFLAVLDDQAWSIPIKGR